MAVAYDSSREYQLRRGLGWLMSHLEDESSSEEEEEEEEKVEVEVVYEDDEETIDLAKELSISDITSVDESSEDKVLEMDQISNIKRTEDEKWTDFLLERKINKIVRHTTWETLKESWLSIEQLIEGKPLTASLLSKCLEVELLLKVTLKNAIERTEFLSLSASLIKNTSIYYSAEFKYYLPLISEAMCQTYICLPSGNEYLNAHGRSLCKVLAYLLTLPREKDSVLFHVVLTIVRKYVEQWTCAEERDKLDELQEYRLYVDATASTCLVFQITQSRSPGDDEIGSEIEKFTSLINKSTLNDKIPENIRKIYLDGIKSISKECPPLSVSSGQAKVPKY